MDTKKEKKHRKYTQTTIEVESTPQSEKKGEATDANANTESTCEESPISLAVLRLELQRQFERYREDMNGDIKVQIESHCKEIRDDIANLRRQTKTDLETIRGELSARVDKLATSQLETTRTQGEIEKSLTDVSDRVATLEKTHQTLLSDNKRLQEKCIDLENRSRRQNIRIVGVAEGAEADNANTFVARFLTEVLGKDNFECPVVIDKAHRSLAPKPRSGERPRAIIARLHYLTDKEKIMSLSRAKGKLSFEGSPVHIFPDMSAEVGRQRAAFNQVKAKLREAGVQYSMQFPARLVISMNGARHAFKDAASVEGFIRTNLRLPPEDN